MLPNEVWKLYSWKNGVNGTPDDLIGNLKIFEIGIFHPLKDAIEIQRIKADTELGWESTKYVMFESGGGEYHLIDGDMSSPSYGMLFYHSIGAVEHDMMISKYDSLYTLFLTIYECTKEKVFSYADEKGFLRIDRDRAFSIAKKLNPRSDYWKLW